MEEHTKPTDEVFNRDNAVEIKAANFVWETLQIPTEKPDDLKSEKRIKKKRKSSGKWRFAEDKS